MSVDELERWKGALPCELAPAQGLLDGLRSAKDEEELDRMRQAQRITDEAFRELLNFIRPGLTERDVAARLVYELLRRGGRKVSFDPIVAAGANGSMPHAVPGETVIQPGMFVTMDFGCVYEGYCSDMTRTVAVGQPTEEMERVYHTVLEAQRAGDRRRPGRRHGERGGPGGPTGDPAGGLWGVFLPQLRPLPGPGDPRVPQRFPQRAERPSHRCGDLRRAWDLSARPLRGADRGCPGAA